jgi:hypothetical protein
MTDDSNRYPERWLRPHQDGQHQYLEATRLAESS